MPVDTLLIGVLAGLLIWAILRAPGAYDGRAVVNSATGGAQQEPHQGSDSRNADRTPTTPTPDDNVKSKENQTPKPKRPRNQASSNKGLFIARAYEIKKPPNLPGDESDEHLDEQARGTADDGMLTKRWRLVGPITTLVRRLTPLFRWTSIERADSYEVTIYDDAFSLIDSSGPIKTTWWRTRKPLERGRLYRWMVTAEKDGKEIFAAPPRGAAFQVIEEAELIHVQRELRKTDSQALRSLIYAEAGLLDDAEIELQRHLENRPYDKQARELVKTIRSWRN
jgi:hypothetical protein